MFGAYDQISKKFIAFHEDFDVVDQYIEGLENKHGLVCLKIKNKLYKSFVDGADLYLIMCNGRYIPYKYEDAVLMYTNDIDYELNTVIRTLERLQECEPDITKKDLKAIERVLFILREKREDNNHHTIPMSTLNQMKELYDGYNSYGG